MLDLEISEMLCTNYLDKLINTKTICEHTSNN